MTKAFETMMKEIEPGNSQALMDAVKRGEDAEISGEVVSGTAEFTRLTLGASVDELIENNE